MLIKKILFLILVVFICMNFSGQKYTPKQIDSLGKIAAFNMADKKEALKLLFKYIDLINKTNERNTEAEIMSYIITVYSELGEYDKLIDYSIKLEDYARKLEDPSYEIFAIRMRGMAYSELGLLLKAENMFKQAQRMASKLKGDKLFTEKGILFGNLAFLKRIMGASSDTLLAYRRKSLVCYKKIQNKEKRSMILTSAYSNIGFDFTEAKQFDSALYYNHKALVLSILRKDSVRQASIFGNRGRIYYESNNQDSALFYLKKALPVMEKNRSYALTNVYDDLALIYEKQKDYKNSLYYRNKYKQIDDSLRSVEKKAANKEFIQTNENNNHQIKSFYFILGGILIILMVIIYYTIQYFRRYCEEKEEKQQKEVLISNLEDKVNDAFEEVIQLAKSDDPSFLSRFKEVYPDFYNKLSEMYPFLTSGQLKFCALLRLNFSTKEIAYYNHLTIRGIETKKNRLRKQLNISSNEDLNNWMMKF
ncbi:tetratricopeptide repeat protein [Chryseobacterium sp. c4a]|uniref:tetratricopeptide repeat protein n=1 Tax=Chryseobacterium sp. c4a TaxID=1573582 RepID=UPI00135AE96A|nr:tetratricopeptide repeat protein [Chryseobacterium sp. c4a]